MPSLLPEVYVPMNKYFSGEAFFDDWQYPKEVTNKRLERINFIFRNYEWKIIHIKRTAEFYLEPAQIKTKPK